MAFTLDTFSQKANDAQQCFKNEQWKYILYLQKLEEADEKPCVLGNQ